MLDEKDLQAIAALMDGKLKETESRMASMMDSKIRESEERMVGAMDSKIRESEERMVGAMDSKIRESEKRMMVMMESYFDPKFNLLAEKMVSAEVVSDLDDRVTVLEDDVHELKMAQ